MTAIRDIQSLFVLVELLRTKVGSPISYSSLARDIGVAPRTVKLWIEVLENLYVIFKVVPYHRNIARAILKEPKIYFYDSALVKGDKGIILENIVALCLLKHNHFLEDVEGDETGLYFLRDKEKREVDFVLEHNGKLTSLIEVKYAESSLNKALQYFHNRFPNILAIQLVYELSKQKTIDGVSILKASNWLSQLKI